MTEIIQAVSADPLLTHAREFTDIEDITLALWLDLENAGQEALAAELLDKGLMFEHYTSLLPNLVAARSDAQLRQQAMMRQIWQEVVDRARATLDG